jgi:hypothetical protein
MKAEDLPATYAPTMALRWRVSPDKVILEQKFTCQHEGQPEWIPVPSVDLMVPFPLVAVVPSSGLMNGIFQGPAIVEQITAAGDPKDGEWWVCAWAEDASRFDGAKHVPVESRFIAYRQVWSDGSAGWSRVGNLGGIESHWVVAIRKVDLS